MATLTDIKHGPVGRLGGFATDHARAIFVAWAVLILVLGAFAPRVEHALSGAGWQADGSESVTARSLIDRSFAGQSSSALTVVVRSSSELAPTVQRVRHLLAGDPRVAGVQPPVVSADGRTAVISAAARPRASTRRVSRGSMIPSSQRRAVE